MQPWQPYLALVFPFLDMVPDELFFHPGRLPSRYVNILTGEVMVDGKPLAAFAADNGLHQGLFGALHAGADARDNPI